MEKKVKHKHKDGKEHAHVGGDKKHEHGKKTKATVIVKPTGAWSTDIKDQKEDVVKLEIETGVPRTYVFEEDNFTRVLD